LEDKQAGVVSGGTQSHALQTSWEGSLHSCMTWNSNC